MEGSINQVAENNEQENLIFNAQKLEQKKRSFFRRAFSPMYSGAMRGSIFALLAGAMGAGVFNLSFRIGEIGVLSYVLFILIVGLFSYIGMYLLSRLIERFKLESYSDMCERAYGKKFKKLAEFCLVLYSWGTTVSYLVIFAKFAIQLLDDTFSLDLYEDNGGRQNEIYTTKGDWVRIIITIVATLFNLIFILRKDIGILQKTSIFGVFAPVFSVFVIAITMFTGFTLPDCNFDCQYHGITGLNWSKVVIIGDGGWSGFSSQLQGLASFIFCFVNHQLLFHLIHDLNNPTKKRMDKIFFRVHFTEIVSYLVIGMAGYLLLVEYVPERDINAVVMASILTTPMSIGKLLLALSLIQSIPLNLFPARQVLFQSFDLERTNKNHMILSLSLAFSGTIIAIFFQNVNSYFGLLGGTAGVMMAGGFPALCYYKVKGLRTTNQKLLVAYMIAVTAAASIGAILSMVDPS